MMEKDSQLMSYQDLLQQIETKVMKVISAVARLEKFLKQSETLYAKGVKRDVKFYLLSKELERAEQSVSICGLHYQTLFVDIDNVNLSEVDLFDTLDEPDFEEVL